MKSGTSHEDRTEQGQIVSFYRDALAALREQAERENPKPLTPDELKQMAGEPYYHVSLNGSKNEWRIMPKHIAERAAEDYMYGKWWLAYRRKPKEEAL